MHCFGNCSRSQGMTSSCTSSIRCRPLKSGGRFRCCRRADTLARLAADAFVEIDIDAGFAQLAEVLVVPGDGVHRALHDALAAALAKTAEAGDADLRRLGDRRFETGGIAGVLRFHILGS